MPRKSKEIHTSRDGAFRFGEFDLYPSERQLHRSQQAVPLPPKVFDALLLFVRHAERLVHRNQLLDALWPDTHVTDANLTNVIVSLRKLLGRQAIQTVSKFGYRFILPVAGEPGIHEATYATFLRAKELATVRSLESMTRARDLLSLCVAQDPTFAAAWAWHGRCSRFLEKFRAGPSVDLELAEAALRRALAIDPHLACAHHFYAQLQFDLGQSRDAVIRLVERIVDRGEEPESYSGLVQGLRFCGMLDESLAAHRHATALDPTIVTSVAHTHFARCEYEAVIETYSATRYYLDAAAWAALGDRARARALLDERLATTQLSPLMSGLMTSLLSILQGRQSEAMIIIRGLPVEREPEVVFYLARHLSMLGAVGDAVGMLRRARSQGFTSPHTLEHDDAFAPLRRHPDFRGEAAEAKAAVAAARRAYESAAGPRIRPADRPVKPGVAARQPLRSTNSS